MLRINVELNTSIIKKLKKLSLVGVPLRPRRHLTCIWVTFLNHIIQDGHVQMNSRLFEATAKVAFSGYHFCEIWEFRFVSGLPVQVHEKTWLQCSTEKCLWAVVGNDIREISFKPRWKGGTLCEIECNLYLSESSFQTQEFLFVTRKIFRLSENNQTFLKIATYKSRCCSMLLRCVIAF